MAVYKSIMSGGGRNLFFALVDDKTDRVETIDLKKWLKANVKDNSSKDSKERVIKAILRNEKQFNKKVDFNMWAKKTKPSFEQTMEYFMKNGFVSNITKKGIKVYEGVEVNEEIKNWGTIQNVFVKFLQANTKVLAKKVQSKDEEGTKAVIKGIIDGLTNAQRSLKLESVNEGILQDREKQLKNLKQGGSASGGGYGTFKKTGRDTFVSPKGKKYNSSALIKLIGTFGDFKVNEDKGEVEKIAKQVGKNEIKFYDALSKVEKRLGSKYPKFLDTALKQLKQNPAKFKTNADKEEAIFQSVK